MNSHTYARPEGEHMTPSQAVARERRPARHRLPRLAVCALACMLTAGTGAAALSATAADAAALRPTRTGVTSLGTGNGALTAGRWTPTEAPLPSTAALDPSVGVRQLTCAAVGWCVGVGTFNAATRNRAGVIEQLSRGNWRATAAPVPRGTQPDAQVALTSVSCPTTRSCGISGYLDTASNRRSEVLTLRNGRWKAQAAPLVPGTDPGSVTSLSSISCPRPGRCVAAGRYQDGDGHYQGLIEVQSGNRWRAMKAPLPRDAGPDPVGGLEWVTCPAAGTCTAVGAYVDRRGTRQLSLDVFVRGRWRSSTAPLPADAADDPVAYLGYVTCRDARDCLAVGNYVSSLGATQGLFERQIAGRWRATSAPVPANADPENPQATINEASCPTTTFCAATGAYRNTDGGRRASLLTLSGRSWKVVAAPAPAGDASGRYVSAVSCPRARWCVAGGSTDASGMFETFSHGRWTVTVAPLPASGFHAIFRSTSVSCPAVRRCAAFGSYTKHSGTRPQGQGLLEVLTPR